MAEHDFTSFTAKDGTEIFYVDIGEGPPLLFLHGFGGSTVLQLPIFERLGSVFRCVCFDQRGYGRTAGAGSPGVVQSAHDALELIEHLNLERVILLGYSMGAAVAFAYIRDFGCRRLGKLIIGDMSPKMINEDGWDLGLYQGWYTRERYTCDLGHMQGGRYDLFSTYFVSQLVTKSRPQDVRDFTIGPDTVAEARKHAGAAAATVDALLHVPPEQIPHNILYWRSMAEDDFRPVLPTIKVPTAIVYAVPGSLYDEAAAHYMRRQIGEAALYPLTECTHMAKNEKQAEFVAIVKAFGLH